MSDFFANGYASFYLILSFSSFLSLFYIMIVGLLLFELKNKIEIISEEFRKYIRKPETLNKYSISSNVAAMLHCMCHNGFFFQLNKKSYKYYIISKRAIN